MRRRKGRGGLRGGGREPAGGGAGPALRDPRPQRVAAAAVSGAGSQGPLLGHRTPSTAVAAAADSCSSRSRRLLPTPPARRRSSYRPPAGPRAACSERQPGGRQTSLWLPADHHPGQHPLPQLPHSRTRGSEWVPEWHLSQPRPSLPKYTPESFQTQHPDPSLKPLLEASTTHQLLSRF